MTQIKTAEFRSILNDNGIAIVRHQRENGTDRYWLENGTLVNLFSSGKWSLQGKDVERIRELMMEYHSVDGCVPTKREKEQHKLEMERADKHRDQQDGQQDPVDADEEGFNDAMRMKLAALRSLCEMALEEDMPIEIPGLPLMKLGRA